MSIDVPLMGLKACHLVAEFKQCHPVLRNWYDSVGEVALSSRPQVRLSGNLNAPRPHVQARDMDLVSAPIILSVVSSRRTVIWVKRQENELFLSGLRKPRRALAACTCRVQSSASQTLASRKFNVFMDPFVGQVHLGSLRYNERKLHSPRAWTLSLHYYAPNADKNQLTDGRVLGRRLLLELPIEGRRNIHSGSYRFFFHGTTIASLA